MSLFHPWPSKYIKLDKNCGGSFIEKGGWTFGGAFFIGQKFTLVNFLPDLHQNLHQYLQQN